MAFSDKIQILNYLDKNYCVKENLFFTIYDDTHEWGAKLTIALSTIFSFEKEFCRDVLIDWASDKGLDDEAFEKAWWVHKLKTTWSPEMTQDMAALYGFDAEAQLTAILSEQIAAEIDSEILRKLSKEIKKQDELIGVLKCIGYEPTETEIDPFSGKSRLGLISMNYNDIKNERKNNNIWQNHLRPTRIDDQA